MRVGTTTAKAQAESLLAFKFDEEGAPEIVAEFQSETDRLALMALARLTLSRLEAESGEKFFPKQIGS